MATNIPVKYIVTRSYALDDIPIVNGQIICLEDTDGWFYDMGDVRRDGSPHEYQFKDSDTIAIKLESISDNLTHWSASIKKHSVTDEYLEPSYLSKIKAEANKAQAAVSSAEAAANRSANFAQVSGEFADESEDHADESSKFASTAQGHANDAHSYASNANTQAIKASEYASEAAGQANQASSFAEEAEAHADDSEGFAEQAQSWATGGTGTRTGEDTNNAKYYAEMAKQAVQSLSGSLVPKGTIMFEQLDDVVPQVGWMYNISNSFITDNRFLQPGLHQNPGINIYYTDSNKWDCMVGTTVSGVKGSAESTFRTGDVEINKANIGLGNVENLSSKQILSQIKVTPEAANTGALVGSIEINGQLHKLNSPAEIVYVTSAEYELLSEEDKMKNVIYCITDDTAEALIKDNAVSTQTTWSSKKIQESIQASADDSHVAVRVANTSKAYLLGTTTEVSSTESNVKSVADPEIYLGTQAGELCVGALNAGSIYSAEWNDYAEWFEKQNVEDKFEPGTILSWDVDGVVPASEENKQMVVGVCSNTYGHILGGEKLEDMSENHHKFVPVAIGGRVNVKVVGQVHKGEFIVPLQNGYGVAATADKLVPGTSVGRALESKSDAWPGPVKIIVALQ